MFPLYRDTFPASADELALALNESVGRMFVAAGASVRIRDKSYPDLEEISVNLDGARARPNPPRPSFAVGGNAPGLRVEKLNVSAQRVSIGPGEVNLTMEASGLSLVEGKDSAGSIVLALEKADNGKIAVTASKAGLEALIAEVARQEAGKHGVSIDDVELTLRPRGARSLEAEIGLRAKKLFVSASLRIAGKLDLDDQLNARISGFSCAGDGAMATLACGMLTPHLDKLNGREVALMALSLGEIRLRDL